MPNLTSITRLLRSLLHREDWNIGIVEQAAADIVRSGITAPVRWLPTPRHRTMLADPAILREPDGTMTLFAEFLDYRRNVGEIHAGVLRTPNVAETILRPLLALPFHMSYPFPFRDETGEVWMTAETWQAGEARLWRREGGAWCDEASLFPGRQVVDPTLWRDGERWWLFCGFQDDRPNHHLHLFHTDRLGARWTPHPANPIVRDPRSSRGAGPIFVAGDLLVRPAQDCSATYGGAVTLNAIRRLDPMDYAEETIRRLAPTPGRYPHGLHTIVPAGEVTVIDGKRLTLDAIGFPGRLRARWPRLPGMKLSKH